MSRVREVSADATAAELDQLAAEVVEQLRAEGWWVSAVDARGLRRGLQDLRDQARAERDCGRLH